MPRHRTLFPVVYPRCLTRTHGRSRWNFVATMCTSWDIYVMSYVLPVNNRHLWFTTCPDIEPYSVFPVVYTCFLIPETLPLEFRCYHVYQLRFVQLNFQSRHLGFLTSAYLLAAYYHCYDTSGVSQHVHLGVAVKISFLASVEQEINHAFEFFTLHLQLPVLSRYIG